ncbi:cupin domain-containing protein [Candidatus Solirubrobacter pratensis]|uniref:cupin domain-containing protein n=1 Tax=Candidatus Solirubrobacter pratensis TaxID=1298857 RepID=UPI0021008170|nr:cupin domain-containing protein [Candidatus Solirubrobacter pratensis]
MIPPAAVCSTAARNRGRTRDPCSFQPGAVAPMHHHVEQQIAIALSGELTFTAGGETRVMHAGDCVVIPPHVEHGGAAGPEGCNALDVFTPPRAGILELPAS